MCLRIFFDDKGERRSAGFAESLIASRDSVVHEAGQEVLPTAAAIEEGPWYVACRSGRVAVAASGLEAEAVFHHGLPFRTVGSRSVAFLAELPVDDKMGDFMGDGVAQEVVAVLLQQLQVDSQSGRAAALYARLAGTTAAQGEVDGCCGQLNAVAGPGAIFCQTHGCFCLLAQFCLCK